jgi:hypothetical protein
MRPTLFPIARRSFASCRAEQHNSNLTHGGAIPTFSTRQR